MQFFSSLVFALSLLLYATAASSDQSPTRAVEVWKSPTCGCCAKWVEHLRANGFTVATKDVAYGVLSKVKRQAGVSPDHASCHTAKVGGYTIEGHVPVEDVKRLLAEKPDAVGLAVPGMPIGSPGMEAGSDKEPYEVLLLKKDGTTEVFARHGQ